MIFLNVLRLEEKIKKRKLSKIVSKFDNLMIIVSEYDINVKGYVKCNSINKSIALLEQGNKINFVFKSFSAYLKLIDLISIEKLIVFKKKKKRTKKIEFLTFNQLESLQLYFDYIDNQEIDIVKRKKGIIVICLKRRVYIVKKWKNIQYIDFIKVKKRKILLKDVARGNYIKIKSKNPCDFIEDICYENRSI